MNIANRNYTYPVLSDEQQDYKTSKFHIDFRHKKQTINDYRFIFDITMDNEELKLLFNQGKAEYIIHIECPTTSYRKVIHSINEREYIDIPYTAINGKVEICGFIVSKDEIKNYKNSDWVDDFDGIEFDFPKGKILGYQNVGSLSIIKENLEFKDEKSIFTIVKVNIDNYEPMNIDTSGNRIKIGLHYTDYDKYTELCNNIQLQPILNSMIILPALVYIFESLKYEYACQENEDKVWFHVLKNAFKKNKLNFYEELNTKESIELAQQVMNYSIKNGLLALSDLYTIDAEEENM